MEYFIKILIALLPKKSWRNFIRVKWGQKVWYREILSSNECLSFDSAQMIISNMGEAVISCITFDYWYRDGIVIVTKRYHKDLFNMYVPEAPCILLQKPSYCCPTLETYCYMGKELSCVLTTNQLGKMNATRKNFFYNWMEHLGRNSTEIQFRKPIISIEAKYNAEFKLKKLNINIDNILFIADEATSVNLLPKKFWDKIVDKAKITGYDVLFNKTDGINNISFTVEEAYYIASKSKMIIGLRSGLIDLLCVLDIPIRIIYTKNDFYGDIQPMYSVKKFPFAGKNVIEYNVMDKREEDILECILEEIEEL